MAGDWIKIEHWTPDKPEVFRIAEVLGIDPDAVTGKLLRIWIWADQQTIDGNATSVTKTLLDRLCSVTGFADALIAAGWLVQDEHGLRFVNFDRHNGQTAKMRALNAKRQAKHKAGNAKGDASVTVESRKGNAKGNAVSVTSALPREEKRREEDTAIAVSVCDTKPKRTPSRGFVAPTVEEVRAYCTERGNAVDPERFVDHYAARGWVMSNGRKIKDWQACVRTWEKNDAERRGHGNADALRPSGGNRPSGGFATHEHQREAANNAALAAFLLEEGIFPGDVGANDAETNVELHQATAKRLVLRSEAVPGADDQSGGRGASNVGDAVSGGRRPIPPVSSEDAPTLFPDGG